MGGAKEGPAASPGERSPRRGRGGAGRGGPERARAGAGPEAQRPRRGRRERPSREAVAGGLAGTEAEAVARALRAAVEGALTLAEPQR